LRNDFGGFVDPAVRDAVGVFASRIQAFASVHRTLGEDSGQARIDAATYLARLCEELCAAHLAPRGVQCEFRADSASLPREVCQKLGLIIVELVTNAAKHAFGGRSGGRVSICLRHAGDAWICQVADNGSGLGGAAAAASAGDGMKLVRGLAKALDADLFIHSDAGGVIATIRLADTDA
jgi:two-component sensor histidine kinase